MKGPLLVVVALTLMGVAVPAIAEPRQGYTRYNGAWADPCGSGPATSNEAVTRCATATTGGVLTSRMNWRIVSADLPYYANRSGFTVTAPVVNPAEQVNIRIVAYVAAQARDVGTGGTLAGLVVSASCPHDPDCWVDAAHFDWTHQGFDGMGPGMPTVFFSNVGPGSTKAVLHRLVIDAVLTPSGSQHWVLAPGSYSVSVKLSNVAYTGGLTAPGGDGLMVVPEPVDVGQSWVYAHVTRVVFAPVDKCNC